MTKEDRAFFEEKSGGLDAGMGLQYNVFCCEQAVIIAETLRTKEKILEFNKAGWDEQKKMVPLLDDGHSGGTFSMSCGLAMAYIPRLKEILRDNKISEILKP